MMIPRSIHFSGHTSLHFLLYNTSQEIKFAFARKQEEQIEKNID